MTDAAGGPASDVPPGIDERAPARGAGEIDVAAAPELVWAVLTDFARWPSWNPDVKSISVDGPAAPGTTFRWRAGPGTITSTIQRVERPRLIAWTGRTLGIRAIHIWYLEPRDGGTAVRTEESFDGLLPRLLRGPTRKALQSGLDKGLGHLKAEAERRARAGR